MVSLNIKCNCMKRIDFTCIELEDLNGKNECKNLSKEIGNMIYKYTGDIAEMDLARAVYHDGAVDLNPQQEMSLKCLINDLPIRAYLKVGILKQFENGIDK